MNDLTESTLYYLEASRRVQERLDAGESLEDIVGPPGSEWDDPLAAVIAGLERDWIEHATLTREGSITYLRWCATDRGKRAIETYRRRARI